jgi:hypothetical protein
MLTVAPAGIIAPFEPETEFSTVAVTWSPTALVLVQMREFACVVSVEPAAIVPTAPPPVAAPLGLVVTVLPLGVVLVAGSDGLGAGVAGFVVGRVDGRVCGRVVFAAGAGAAGAFAGTSLSCGCTVVS